MAERSQRPRVNKRREEKQAESLPTKQEEAKGQDLKEQLDDLLDEIDGVLEQNAERFVRDYVQKGGE